MKDFPIPKAAIFDFDGTLFDSMWVWTQLDHDFLRSFGVEPPPGIGREVEAMTIRQACEHFRRRFGLEETADQLMDRMLDMTAHAYAHQIQPFGWALEYLPRLGRQKVPAFIVTAGHENHVQAALARCGLAGYFSGILTPENTGLTKAQPEIFLLAARHMEVEPADCLVFEDSLHAAQTARLAGFPVALMGPDKRPQKIHYPSLLLAPNQETSSIRAKDTK